VFATLRHIEKEMDLLIRIEEISHTYWRHFFASLSGDIDWPPGPRTH
jgi:hypothetical protein